MTPDVDDDPTPPDIDRDPPGAWTVAVILLACAASALLWEIVVFRLP